MTIKIFSTSDELATGAANFIAGLANQAIAARGQFNIALSGGGTPVAAYRKLAAAPFVDSIDWLRTHIFWSDERCVPPTDPDSNYLAAKSALLDVVPLPQSNIHRIHGELDADKAAELYRTELAAHFKTSGIPIFDLVLLGLGEDGHTASLFPRSQALIRGEVPVAENYIAHLESWRVSFTFPLINSSREVAFLVSGKNKAGVVKEIIETGEKQYPAKAIQPQSGKLTWLLDAPAAALLKSS